MFVRDLDLTWLNDKGKEKEFEGIGSSLIFFGLLKAFESWSSFKRAIVRLLSFACINHLLPFHQHNLYSTTILNRIYELQNFLLGFAVYRAFFLHLPCFLQAAILMIHFRQRIPWM